MQVTIGDIPVVLTCTAEGKQALRSNQLTPRQRQLILLVEEDTPLAAQAVSNLLPKLDLQSLIEKGWISCDVPQVQNFKQPLAVAALANNIATTGALPVEADATVLSKKSFDKKHGINSLQSFLNTYANVTAVPETSVHMPKVDLPKLPQAQSTDKHLLPNQTAKSQPNIPQALRPTQGQALEDIMIVQSLLED